MGRTGRWWYDANVSKLLGTMITTTSYGTWLPGDVRGYVERGVILGGNPKLLEQSTQLLSLSPVFFDTPEQEKLHLALVVAAKEFSYHLHAVSIESWHAHWVIAHDRDGVATMVGRLKTRMRQVLDRGRIWTSGYDKRFCFDRKDLDARIDYVQRHAGHRPIKRESAPTP